ncbi:MAG TPA: hypothetical protein VI454_10950 [Verrucomicrobiae bacterium]
MNPTSPPTPTLTPQQLSEIAVFSVKTASLLFATCQMHLKTCDDLLKQLPDDGTKNKQVSAVEQWQAHMQRLQDELAELQKMLGISASP